jgi:peptide/nickel transport system substrate-binding protein
MRLSAVVAALGVAALGGSLAACGGDGSKGSGTAKVEANASSSVPTDGRRGGALTFIAAADVDYIDPGLDYYQFGQAVQAAVNRTLYAYRPDDSVKPIPDLAEGPPEISADRKTVTVRIRRSVFFSPPVNREVKAQDVKYAFERAFTKNVPNGYTTTYFGDLVGVPAKPNTTGYRPISGIETPDDQTLVFHFKHPTAVLAAGAMVMPITSPVPKEYAQQFDEKLPSTYDKHVAFTGPYMVRNDAQGNLVGRKPGQVIELVRNPRWNSKSDFRAAYLDKITIQEGNTDLAVAARRALTGSHSVSCDTGAPPAQVLKEALSRQKDQVKFIPAGNTRWISMNTEVKPFDNVNVRKAVIAAVDRTALLKTIGGTVVGTVANGYIPPGIPGFEEAGGLKQNADLDFMASPSGDLEVAKRYMLKAKAQGVPVTDDGRYAGNEELLVVAVNADPGKRTAEVAADQIGKLGFKLKVRNAPTDTMYTKFCMVPSAKVPICPNVGFGKDFADPQSLLDPTFNGARVTQSITSNYSMLDDKAINGAMAKATTSAGADRNRAWADINRMVAEQAPAIPWVWDKYALIESKDVAGVTNAFFNSWDFSFTSLK